MKWLPTVCASLALVFNNASALTLDTFEGEQAVFSGISSPLTSSTVDAAGAIGGLRTIQTQLSQGLQISCNVHGGYLSYSQNALSSGQALIVWDGNPLSNFDPAGLGSVDLTQDGSNAFILKINSFDFPFQKSATLRLTIFDSKVTNGSAWSAASIQLDRAYTESDDAILIPYSAFTIQGAAPGNIKSVGALSLSIEGPSTDIGLVIDYLKTNGSCALIPGKTPVVDDCGVCGGDGTSCHCTTISMKREHKSIRNHAEKLLAITLQQAQSGSSCGGDGYSKHLASSRSTYNKIITRLTSEYKETELSCEANFCAQIAKKNAKGSLRRAARKLRSQARIAYENAMRDCRRSTSTSVSARITASAKKLRSAIAKLPAMTTQCG